MFSCYQSLCPVGILFSVVEHSIEAAYLGQIIHAVGWMQNVLSSSLFNSSKNPFAITAGCTVSVNLMLLSYYWYCNEKHLPESLFKHLSCHINCWIYFVGQEFLVKTQWVNVNSNVYVYLLKTGVKWKSLFLSRFGFYQRNEILYKISWWCFVWEGFCLAPVNGV